MAILLFTIGAMTIIFAQDAVTAVATPTPRPHGAMEVFGMGPELFADRGKAWVEAISVVLDTLVAKLGLLVIAIIALRKNITNAELKDRVDRVSERADKNSEEITKVALAVPAATEQPRPIL